MAKPIMSLEQFAALESWIHASSELAGLKVGKPGVDHAKVITSVYQKRMHAMLVLTGAKPPPNYEPPPEEDDNDLA